jgi:hypothetical protein
VIAGGAGARGHHRRCGIPNVLTKSIGSHNPHNVVKATIVALESLRDRNAVAENARPGSRGEGKNMEGKIKIKLVRSPICTPEKHKVIVRGWAAEDQPGGGAARIRRASAAW